ETSNSATLSPPHCSFATGGTGTRQVGARLSHACRGNVGRREMDSFDQRFGSMSAYLSEIRSQIASAPRAAPSAQFFGIVARLQLPHVATFAASRVGRSRRVDREQDDATHT